MQWIFNEASLSNCEDPGSKVESIGVSRDREQANASWDARRFMAHGRGQRGIGAHASRRIQRRARFGIQMDEPASARDEEEMENL